MNFERDTSYRVLTARRSRLYLASEDEIWVSSIWGVIVKNFIIRDLYVCYLKKDNSDIVF